MSKRDVDCSAVPNDSMALLAAALQEFKETEWRVYERFGFSFPEAWLAHKLTQTHGALLRGYV